MVLHAAMRAVRKKNLLWTCGGAAKRNREQVPEHRQNRAAGNNACLYTGETDENYLDDVYFIGDSRTVGLVRAGMPEDHLFAETGMCHEDALTKRVVILDDTAYLTIPDALQIVAPKIAVVNFGINGIGFMDEDAFIDEYRTMMQAFQKMSPETVFIIESILPVSSSYESTSGVTNEKIDEMNLRLCALAEELWMLLSRFRYGNEG